MLAYFNKFENNFGETLIKKKKIRHKSIIIFNCIKKNYYSEEY